MKIIFHKITLILFFILCATNSFGQTCTVPTSERDALIALYTATNGSNWTNNTNWNTAADVCDWYGVTVTNGAVTEIRLTSNNLNGEIPSTIENLTGLTLLYLSNNQLTGVIPSELGNMLNLTYLSLQTNQLSGAIPFQIGNLTNLAYLNLQNNQLSGAIPFQIGNLTNLKTLHLLSNQLTGNIPSELGNLSGLQDLDLRNNQLTGNIPLELGNLSGLRILYLQNNQLSGSIPAEIGNLTNLTDLRLEFNQITGSIPTEIGNLTNLNSSNLSYNQLTGNIPAEISTLLNLDYFWFNNNAFIFSDFENEHTTYLANLTTYTYIPQDKVDTIETPTVTEGSSYTFTTSLSSLNNSYQWYKDGVAISGATSKDYTINSVALSDSGVYHVVATNSIVTGLTLQRNNITLNVQTSTCIVPQSVRNALMALYNATDGPNWTNNTNWNTSADVCDWYGVIATVVDGVVTGLDLRDNQLSGSIPAEIGNLTNLTELHLEFNNITGSIPTEIGNLTNLTDLNLYANQITGPLPSEIENLTNLTQLNLEFNQITGSIPTGIGSLTNLNRLSLSHNKFTGSIPAVIEMLASLNLDYFGFDNNAFVFSDFENEHATYIANITTYTYSPQAKVDTIETPTVTEGSSYTFTTSLSSPNNSYQWYKDGIAISGATSKDYTINPVSLTDAGVYYVVATNSIVTGLTLQRNDVTLTVTPDTCGVPQGEKDALMALYNATNGPNWTNNTNWNTTVPVCDWYGVTVTNGTVTNLVLGVNSLIGNIPPEIGNLTNLTGLALNNNQLNGVIPTELGDLTALTSLNLGVNQLTGNIPATIWNLSNLTSLTLYINQLTGSIPVEIGNLTNLTSLNLYGNQLTEPIPVEITSLLGLTNLNLGANQLSGTIPVQLGNLTSLTSLHLESNQLSGTIPVQLGNLINLQSLWLNSNLLTGNIPIELGNLSLLDRLYLYSNQLTGNIPTEFGNLANIQYLYLYSNQLVGDIPSSLSTINALEHFRVQQNKFVFSDFENEHTTYLANLTTYTFIPQDKVDTIETPTVTEGSSYTLTTSLSSSNNSYQWYKDGVAISGATSKDYTINPVSLTDAGVYYVVATNSIVTGLTLQRNDVTLTVTPDTCGVPQSEKDALMALYDATNGPNWTNTLANNQAWDINTSVCDWYGITVSNGTVTELSLSSNGLSGTIPVSISNLVNLNKLQLNNNNLSGSIPSEIGNLSNLNSLRLYTNQLTGPIPPEIGNLTNLKSLNLSSNQLTGSIPIELSYLVDLTSLTLSGNQLSGTIPTGLGNLTNLTGLSLYGNQLSGSIPAELGNLTALNYLRLSDNQLSGNIPSEIGNLTQLTYIHLGQNDLSGNIPVEIGNLTQLTYLDLYNNQLSGNIPTEITNLTSLTTLTLSKNQLAGSIPSGISFLTTLQIFKFYDNNFIFSDFENEHNTYTTNLTTYTYSPQAKVDVVETPTVTEGSSYTFTTSLSSPNNSYQWYKDGAAISGATSKDYTINPVSLTDAGVYYVVANNSIVTGLTLQRNDVTLTVTPDTCGVPQSEKDALMALYDATNGPDWTNTLSNTQVWDINTPVCDWYGVTVTNGTVTSLNLYNNQLIGTIPSELGNLLNLQYLYLYENSLTGNIPPELGNLTNLKQLWLWDNQLTGGIPLELGNLSSLQDFSLANNQLTGSIPPELGNLSTLEFMNLSNNQLTGNIPPELGGLNTIIHLYLQNNQLSGNIPTEMENLSTLVWLFLNNNQLTGIVPPGFANLHKLNNLQLHDNQLYGSLPKLGVLNDGYIHLPSYGIYEFENNNFIFSDFENEHNEYEGKIIPYTYSPQAKVDAVETPTVTEGSSYTFTTSLSSPNNSYQWYKDGIAISGATSKDYTINPVGLTDAGVYYVVATNSIVTGLTLQRNDVTLTVTPDTCGVPQSERDALMALYATNGPNWTNTLANNQPWDINTPVCDWYGVTVTNGNVTGLNLNNNNLSGTIPPQLGDLSNLQILNLAHNTLTGSIPSEFGNLSLLNRCELQYNQLTGAIPSSIGNLINLDYLVLSHNQITSIPSSIQYLTNLTVLYVSNNQLSAIPSELGMLTGLVELSLHKNQITGGIPTSFGGLTGLYFLHLNDNQLSGTIPSGLTTLTHLRGFKFHNNKFVFEDFEADHPTLEANISSFYVYSPQAKVDQEETINLIEGDSYTLTTSLSSSNNHYQWEHSIDGINWTGVGTDSSTYVINSATSSDVGIYRFTATNNVITGLILERNTITINVALPLTQYCFEGIYEDGDPVHPNGGTITYNDQNGIEHSISGITIEDGIVSVLSSSVPTKTGVGEITCPVEIVIDSTGNCSSPPDFSTNIQTVYVDSSSIPLSNGYILYQDSALTTPFNGGGNVFMSNYAQSNEAFAISSSGVISSHSVCANNAPIANAGTDASITLPTNLFTLDGSQSYDSNGTIVSYLWTKISGGPVVFNDANAVSTEVSSLEEGIYEFQLTVTDNDSLIDTDTITVTVNPDISISNVCFSGNSIITESENKIENNLTLSMKDDSTISFIDATIVAGFFGNTEVVLNQPFNSQGSAIFNTTTMGQSFPFSAFRIEYTINSSSGTYESSETIYSYDWVQPAITANFQCSTSNTPPTANAGVDDSIVLPTNTYTLDGSQSFDSDGTIVSYLWTKASGGTATFSDANIVNPQVASLEEGTYVFQLTVTDDDGASATDTVTVFVLVPGQENSFCTSEWSEYPTINDLTPSGTNIEWYATETEGIPLDKTNDLDLENVSGTTYWWDDITDNILTRTAATIMLDQGTPIHNFEEEYQFLPTNATVADLQMTGSNIQWFDSAFNQTPLNSTDFLVHGATYYVEDVGTSTCRLAVEVYVGTVPPKADNIQYVCPNARLNNLIVIPQIGATLVWYDSETGGNILSNILVQDGVTYYAAQIGADSYESFERTPINVIFNEVNPPTVPSNTQKFYSNEEHTVANLLARGNNVKWYTEQGNLLSENTTVLENGLTYYAEQTDGGCISERIPVTVVISEEELPTIISCEKFKPQIGGHYVISGWVREQGASATPGEVHDFTEVSDLFVELLNHLKDKLLSDNLFDLDMPSNSYIPESEVDFDPLVQFVQGIQSDEHKLTVYNFKRIEDDYGGIENGRLIGFQFALNKSGFPVFEYRTPTISVPLCPSCFSNFQQTIEVNYPLLGNGSNVLNFTNARVSNGSLYITQSFNAVNPSLVINDQEIQIPGSSPLLESITYYDYNEASYYQPLNYNHVQIELSYIGEDDQIINDEIKIFSPNGAIIDGWQKIVGEFTIPSNAKLLNIHLKSNSSDVNAYFDDVRIHPFDSNMKTFVYHPETQRLMSELDENNYATFYEYDLEGGLVRVKKETEKGIYTIQETRSGNVKATN